jgi:hypothetical protein
MKVVFRWFFALVLVAGLVCLGGGLWYLALTVRAGNGRQDVAMIVDWAMSLGGTAVGLVVTLIGAIGFSSLRSKTDLEHEAKVEAEPGGETRVEAEPGGETRVKPGRPEGNQEGGENGTDEAAHHTGG